jgi:2-C-methyl-D-erythritol 4-phosphate cytidylyltransferase/2-C-methyl-D-erythritol 2,4-cyclodiphosphate synthase
MSVNRTAPVTWTILVAAGEGRRFGGPKQLQPLGGRRVIDWAVDSASRTSSGVVVVAAADQVDLLRDGPEALAADRSGGSGNGTQIIVTAGGATRSESVRAGIAATPHNAEVIVVHDAARPLATDALFSAVVNAVAAGHDGAAPAVAVTDTIRHVDRGPLDRSQLRAVQTPQAFRAEALRRAHANRAEATDDATLVEGAGGTVQLVEGDPDNLKITAPGDLQVVEALLASRSAGRPAAPLPLVGIGFDIHRFSDDPDRVLVLGGVRFEDERGLEGHSDADAVAHACCDAILGVAGLGDIGSLFPDDDDRWRGADSTALLAEAAERVRRSGRRIGNIDCTVVTERPKIAPRRAEMQQRLSEAAGAPVTVRGKRAETLGALGRREGIACWAVAVLT